MAQTFEDCWRTVLLYVPAAPPFLVREWVNVAWKQLANARNWSFLRGEGAITIAAPRTITTVVVTQGSTTVTSTGQFLAADAGRQFRIGRGATYTIVAVTDLNTIVLDRAWEDVDASAQTAIINDAYVVMPADFGSFRVIVDTYNRRRIAWWITEDQLLILDPDRSTSDTGIRSLVAQSFSTYPPTLGRVRYETWPRPTSARTYPMLYNKQAASLTDVSVFTGVLADGAQVVISGALSQAAGWPGTPDLPNPYFNRGIVTDRQTDFLNGIQRLSLKDDDQYADDLAKVHWERWPLADIAYDDRALRASDSSVGALL